MGSSLFALRLDQSPGPDASHHGNRPKHSVLHLPADHVHRLRPLIAIHDAARGEGRRGSLYEPE